MTMWILRRVCYVLLPLLGLLWAMGCSSPTGGGGGNGNGSGSYQMDLIIEPDSVYTDTGKGDVSCFLSYDGTILDGAQINFSAYSQDVSEATITAASWSSPTSPTGLSSAVYYRPRDFTGDVDTLFAVHYGAEEDTLAWNFTTITILHP